MSWGGSLVRPEATGYGAVMFADQMLRTRGASMDGQTVLVSGVDVVITAGADTEHPEEVRRFVEFLMQPEVVQEYAEAQVAIPTLEGASNDDPARMQATSASTTSSLAGAGSSRCAMA